MESGGGGAKPEKGKQRGEQNKTKCRKKGYSKMVKGTEGVVLRKSRKDQGRAIFLRDGGYRRPANRINDARRIRVQKGGGPEGNN